MSKPYRIEMKYKKEIKVDIHKKWTKKDDQEFLKRIGCA